MKFSIITINYNNREGLQKTIESVIHQSSHDFEYIIIDGGSTDGSAEVIKQYSQHIDYWVSEPDKGIYNAMNKGISKASGEYLNFMNSGDTFYDDDVLRSSLPYMNKDILLGGCYNVANKRMSYQPPYANTMRYLYETAFSHQASFIKRTLFCNSPYREDLKIASDWEFFIRKLVFEDCSFSTIPVTICNYDGNGVSANQEVATKERQRVLSELLPSKIWADYDYFKGKDSRILQLCPLFNHTYRLEIFIYSAIRSILWIYYRILKHDRTTKIPHL